MNNLDVFRRELGVFVDESLSAARRLEVFVAISSEVVEEFRADWAEATEGKTKIDVIVDGAIGKVTQVKSGGTVVARARTLGIVAERALQLYSTFVKVLTGDMAKQLGVFVGGEEFAGGAVGDVQRGSEIVITNLAPFSRKAEFRSYNDADSSGFTDGLFQSVASLLAREVKGLAEVRFEWRDVAGRRLPAVVIR